MSVKKIELALARIGGAGTAAVKLLNELSENAFEGSIIEQEPVAAITEIIRQLHLAKQEHAQKETYAGLSEAEIADRQTADKADELATLQAAFSSRLDELAAKRDNPPAVEPADESTEAGLPEDRKEE